MGRPQINFGGFGEMIQTDAAINPGNSGVPSSIWMAIWSVYQAQSLLVVVAILASVFLFQFKTVKNIMLPK
ncbi:MAG: hypothetical protein Ct9H300mP6_06960 [Gammaproteobacteria bacterium]|nr:MAG: hypothetical protein Ct9H300mP6_06960 [Gammaproteobacteria bacterium]